MNFDDQPEEINLLTQCPTCQSTYHQQDARLIQKQGSTSIFHLSCWSCQSALLISIKRRPSGIVCSVVITDCNYEDAVKFKQSPKISVDDVIEAHNALELDNLIEIR